MTTATHAVWPRPGVPDLPRAHHVEVLHARTVTPHMRRITLGGAGLADFVPLGGDQWFRLFLPPVDHAEPVLPVTAKWWPEVMAMPDATRPTVRNYTVRAARPGEIDVDVVMHGDDEGPAARWARLATPGDRVGIMDQGVTYDWPTTAAWQLIVADEAALPAAAGILASIPADTVARALIELPHRDDAQNLGTLGVDTTVRWLPRPDGAKPGAAVLDTLYGADLPAGEPYVFLAGESGMVKRVRRHLVHDRGVPTSTIRFIGYWRRGVSFR
ncbi:MAG: siderophore-interacting protein [Streptosporangiales bacterium]